MNSLAIHNTRMQCRYICVHITTATNAFFVYPFLSVCLGHNPTEAFWTKANAGPLYILEVPLLDRIQGCLLSYIGILVANHEQYALCLAIVWLWQIFENWSK